MSAAATAAGYLYASGRIGKRADACPKRRYDNEIEALSTAAYRTGRGSPPLRVYGCEKCNGWHLTSEAKRA